MSELNLNLDNILPPPRPPKQSLLKAVLLLQAVILVLLLAVMYRQLQHSSGEASGGAGLSQDQLRELALKMEDLDLPRAAASLWEKYIAEARPAPEKHARILYRLGVLCQQSRLYEEAVGRFAQSEAVCRIDSLSPEIGRRTQECLEQLGLFSAGARDLQNRTDLTADGQPADSPVLAEIGPWKITRRELERQAEQSFDQTCRDNNVPPEEALKAKKRYMQGLSKGENLVNFLQQFVIEQLITREIREQKLREDEQVLRKCRAFEKQLLFAMVLDKAAGHPSTTEAEARKYYDSHQDEFKKDDKIQAFDQVKDGILNQLTGRKKQAAQQQYFQDLMNKYDVVFHASQLPPPPAPDDSPRKSSAPAPAPAATGTANAPAPAAPPAGRPPEPSPRTESIEL